MPREFLLSFYGDDFTGSTDAMESLAKSGVKTILFTSPPTIEQLHGYPDLQAFGIAGQTRSMTPFEMEKHLRPAFAAMKASGAKFSHYKVCSTFDSSPEIGNIGRVIEIGSEVFESQTVPIVVGAPDLGRYVAFGNLYARYGTEIFRIDRHPSMSKHPVTPMDEADLRRHLAKQTSRHIALLDLLRLNGAESREAYESLLATSPDAVVFDTVDPSHLPAVGALLDRSDTPFIVGSSGVESALTAHWESQSKIAGTATFPRVTDNGPILAVCGSMSPVTASQIKHAIAHGFVEIRVERGNASQQDAMVRSVADSIRTGKSVVVHTGERIATLSSEERSKIGQSLGSMIASVAQVQRVNRIAIAGGDTSGEIARALRIESMEMIGELTRGAPLVRVHAPESPADKVEMVFKGGQIGPDDFFSLVRNGPQHGVK